MSEQHRYPPFAPIDMAAQPTAPEGERIHIGTLEVGVPVPPRTQTGPPAPEGGDDVEALVGILRATAAGIRELRRQPATKSVEARKDALRRYQRFAAHAEARTNGRG